MFKRKYPVTSKIKYAFQKRAAREKLAQTYVVADRHDRAVKAFEETEVLKDKAWDLVFELYPRLKRKSVTYIWASNEIVIKEEKL